MSSRSGKKQGKKGGEVDQAKGKPVVYLRRKADVLVTGITLQARPPGYSGKKSKALREWHQTAHSRKSQ